MRRFWAFRPARLSVQRLRIQYAAKMIGRNRRNSMELNSIVPVVYVETDGRFRVGGLEICVGYQAAGSFVPLEKVRFAQTTRALVARCESGAKPPANACRASGEFLPSPATTNPKILQHARPPERTQVQNDRLSHRPAQDGHDVFAAPVADGARCVVASRVGIADPAVR